MPTKKPLAGRPATKKVQKKVIPTADAPTAIGTLHAQSASLWCLAIDAQDASAWKGDAGYDYDEDVTRALSAASAASDFGRALKVGEKRQRAISVGKAQGLIVTVGGCGWSTIWRIDSGIMLVDFAPSDDVDESKPATTSRVGASALHAKVKGKPRSVGKVQVRSGVLALLLPSEAGDLTTAQIKKAAGSTKALNANPSRALVPLRSGEYECFVDRIDLRNETLGWIDNRVRIVQRSRFR